MTIIPTFSQRFLRKGPLVEETYGLFADWRDDATTPENLAQAFSGKFSTNEWAREVRVTTSGRLNNLDAIRPLVVLARNGMKLADWRDCWRLWIGATEEPFGGFVRDWLFTEYAADRYQFRADDVRDHVQKAWAEHSPDRPLSDYGVARAARDLVLTATKLGMLSGKGPTKTFSTHSLSDDVLAFYVQMIAELEGSPSRVPSSTLWRTALMSPADVHVTLLHLHQFRRLDYQVAGTLVQLTLPFKSPLAFAESLAA